MNSNKDFCRNVCALMAKLNKALYIQHSLQFMWQKVWGYLKTTDVSISTFFFFTLRRPSSIRFWLIMRAEGVYCFILSCLSTASVIIFILAWLQYWTLSWTQTLAVSVHANKAGCWHFYFSLGIGPEKSNRTTLRSTAGILFESYLLWPETQWTFN